MKTTRNSILLALVVSCLLSMSAHAQLPAPFAGGVKLQHGGVSPALGLTMKALAGYSGDVTLNWQQPTTAGILKVTSFAAGVGTVNVTTLNLASATDVGTSILGVVNGGTGVSSFTGNSVVVTNAGGTALTTKTLGDGQLLIGSAGNAPVVANLTAGTGVTITNNPGSITISTSLSNISNKQRYTLSAAAFSYTANAPPAGFVLNATSVINITVFEAGGFPITATVTAINTIANTFDFVISGFPTAGSSALVTFQN